MAKHLRQDMPPYAKVRAEYLAGMSWTQLGNKYHVDHRSLYGFMKRDAQRIGHTWPLRRSGARQELMRLDAYGRCPALGLRLELLHFREWSGMEYKDIAAEAGLNRTTVHKITGGFKTSITKETRDKIMAVITKYEKERGVQGERCPHHS